jgi:predicted nucleotidyltransferase
MQTTLRRALVRKYAPILAELKGEFRGRLKMVVLFGSQARGEASSESDHDLFLVIEDLPVDPVARARQVRSVLLPVLHRLPGAISFVARTPEEFAAKISPLTLEVCVDGICLFGTRFFEPYRRKALAALQSSGLERAKWGQDSMWVFPKQPVGNWELSWEGFREGV